MTAVSMQRFLQSCWSYQHTDIWSSTTSFYELVSDVIKTVLVVLWDMNLLHVTTLFGFNILL